MSEPAAQPTVLGLVNEDMAAPTEVSLHDKVRFLSQPAAYTEPVARVGVHETHMSYVFLTPTQVYKMKKPVAHQFADLRTLEDRCANCHAEVHLNRRLAADVYLGVVALAQGADGELCLGGSGRVVEWLVHMRRLPADAMLDYLIRHDRLRTADVIAVANRLGEFFASQPGVDLSGERYRAQLRQQLELSVQLLGRPEFGLSAATVTALGDALNRYLDDGSELDARVHARRIVEGHGDLRPEHVCLLTPPVVIDCLEFNRDLRLLDPFDEIAFLGLECARLGAAWAGPLLQESIQALLHDFPPPRLSAFYTALRACVRARLAVAHLLDSAPSRAQEWLPLARDYLARAQRACAALD